MLRKPRFRPIETGKADDKPGWSDRLLTALATPVLFNLSLLIAAALLGQFVPPRLLQGLAFRQGMKLASAIGSDGAFGILHLVVAGCWLLPAFVGLCLGCECMAGLLGHLFLTKPEAQRNLLVTVVFWYAFLGLALTLSWAMHG